MKAACPNCSVQHEVGAVVGGKLACATAGALFGHTVTRNPLAALACAGVGLVFGHVIDREIVPRCPACGVALQILAATL